MEIGKKIEALLGERRGRPEKEIVVNCAQFSGTKTRDIAAEKAGFESSTTEEGRRKKLWKIFHNLPGQRPATRKARERNSAS